MVQQKQQLANTEAALPAARAAVDRTLWRLAALLGRDPSRARAEDYRLPDRLPPAPALPGLGSPADLLAHTSCSTDDTHTDHEVRLCH